MTADTRLTLTPDMLPIEAPEPCPVCGAKVLIHHVIEWGTDDGSFSQVEYECETEPNIDDDEWPGWHAGHFAMPYVDWLPWESRMMAWINKTYRWEPGR